MFLLAGFLPELHFGGVDPAATGLTHRLKGIALDGFAYAGKGAEAPRYLLCGD
jgi:hypothetical protein